NFPTGSEDVNDNGVVSQAPVSFSGTLDSALSGPTGRVVVDLSGFIPATRWVIYPSTGGLLMLEADSITATLGNAYAQTSTSLPASQNYGFNLSAVDLGNGSPFEEDDLAQFLTSSTGFTGTVDINDEGGTTPSQSFVGTFPAPADSTGRGTATTTAANNTFVSFTYYVVNASTVLLLETDTIQTGAGTFELQNSSGAGPVGQSRISLIRPSARSHGAFHHK